MTLATERVVLLRYTRDGGGRRGSGLRVGGTLVLTAAHCAQGTDHTVIVGGQNYPAEVVWNSGRADLDIAVLTAPDLAVLPGLSCARVNTGIATRIKGCVALGFPKWSDTTSKRRAQADGSVATGDWADPEAPVGAPELLIFKIADPPIRDVPVGDLDKETTPWGGMSGAVIVTGDDQIVGVVRGHAPAAGVGRLTFTPLAAIDVLPVPTAAEFWELLGVPDPHALPVLPVPKSAGANAIVVGQIPARPPGFVRRGVMDQLADRRDEARVTVVSALTGMRGVGKTHVAAAYAHSWIEAGRGLVGWVNAESINTAVADLARIAEAVGVADPEGDSATSARRLAEHLATRPGDSLLVFDNAADPDRLRPYLPLLGRTRVVITTTDTAFTEFGEVVDVERFTPPESLRYLQDRTGIDDAAGAAELAGELGDLPLALAAAASTIGHRRHRDYSRYLHQLRSYPVEEVLRRPAGADYPRSTAAALGLSLDALARDDPTGAARRLIGILSVLSPDGVRGDLLQTMDFNGDGEAHLYAVEEAIELCARYCLLSWSVQGEVVIMHRLTARVVRERAAAAGTLDQVVDDALTVLESRRFDASHAWAKRELGAQLVVQIEALWETTAQGADNDSIARALNMRTWAVRQLCASADLTRAIEIGQRSLVDCERILGVEHPDTLESRINLADAYKSTGRLEEAIRLYEATLAECERALAADQPHTRVSRNNLAYAYESVGRVDEAIQLFERTVADCECALGVDHPDTVASRNNLAGAYRSAGRFEEALPLHRQVVDDSERLLGIDHPHALTSRDNLAGTYESAKRLPEAIDLFERTLADRERVLGADHPDTVTSRNNLAGAYESANRVEEAIKLYESTVADRERILGADHPDTLASRSNLAVTYLSARRLEEAIELFRRTLADRERVLGADHPDTQRSRDNLAGAYESANRVEEAIKLYESTIADRERILGPDHHDTLESRDNLAIACLSAQRATAAIPLFERTLDDRERILGADHPDTVESRSNLAGAYLLGNRMDDAIDLYERTLTDYERVWGPEDAKAMRAHDNLARAYMSANRAEKAIPHCERIFDYRKRILGADHPDTLESRHNLASAYLLDKRVDDAIPHCAHTLADRKRILGADHPDTLESRHNLASAYLLDKRVDDAIRLFERNLADRERVLGLEHPDTLISRDNLAYARTLRRRPD